MDQNNTKKFKKFVVGSIYRPLDSSHYLPTNFEDLLANALYKVNEAFREVILMGDVNANNLDKNNCKELKCVLSSNGFKQLIKSPTRLTQDTSTLIDVILATREENIAKTITAPLSLSVHDLMDASGSLIIKNGSTYNNVSKLFQIRSRRVEM